MISLQCPAIYKQKSEDRLKKAQFYHFTKLVKIA